MSLTLSLTLSCPNITECRDNRDRRIAREKKFSEEWHRAVAYLVEEGVLERIPTAPHAPSSPSSSSSFLAPPTASTSSLSSSQELTDNKVNTEEAEVTLPESIGGSSSSSSSSSSSTSSRTHAGTTMSQLSCSISLFRLSASLAYLPAPFSSCPCPCMLHSQPIQFCLLIFRKRFLAFPFHTILLPHSMPY